MNLTNILDMGWRSIIVSIIAFVYSITLFGQSSLFNSQRHSSELYIYKLSAEILKRIHMGEEKFEETILTDFVFKYSYGSTRPNLPRGNYVEVRAEENNLVYTEFVVDDLYVKIIPTETFSICLHDSLGNIITDATLSLGKRKMSYDRNLQYYNAKNAKTDDIVSILHKGVYHYLRVERNWPYGQNISLREGIRSRWYEARYRFKNIFGVSGHNHTQSFMVFSKPMYKPNEKVKFKAYLEKRKWKPYRDSVNVRLIDRNGYTKSKVLTTLAPYRPGMYSYSFDLNQDLGLILDKSYHISLESSRTKKILYQETFRYEDYELKSIAFSMASDRREYAKGDSIRIKLKALNENEMPTYDGSVELKVIPTFSFSNNMKANQVSFIPDTLWQRTVSLAEVAERSIILPDSIFPTDMEISFQVIGTYLSSDNERQESKLDLRVLKTEKEIRTAVKEGQAEIKYFEKGVEKTSVAEIGIIGENDEVLRTEKVNLPYILPLPWQATEITVNTNGIHKTVDLENEDNAQLSYQFYRAPDSVILKVSNPSAIPFWYKIRKANRIIASGHGVQLNRTFAERGKDGYSMEITYLFGGRSKVIREELPFVQKNLSLEVNTATTVYPGQKAEVQLSVTDKTGKPLKDVDITAYGFTSKFKSAKAPNVRIGGLMRNAKSFQNLDFELDEDLVRYNSALMDWARWSKEMSLDTIAFYQFLFPKDYYQASKPIASFRSQISPYVVLDGKVQGVHMLWIDDILTYAKQAQHHSDYVFEISPGRHDFRFRTKDRDISVKGFYVEKESKTIVAFNVANEATRLTYEDSTRGDGQILVKVLPKQDVGKLREGEMVELKKQLISVTNNFGAWKLPNLGSHLERPAYIRTASDLYYLNPVPNTIFNNRLGARVAAPILVGPFPRTDIYNGIFKIATLMVDSTKIDRFQIEGGYEYTLYKNYQKLKNWDTDYIRKDAPDFKPNLDFSRSMLTLMDIAKDVDSRFLQTLQNNRGLAQVTVAGNPSKEITFNLNLSVGSDAEGKNIQPALIFIEPAKEADRRYFRLYYGAERIFRNLPVSDVILHVVKDDSTSYSLGLTLKSNGTNYLRLDSIPWHQPSTSAALSYKLVRDETVTSTVSNPLRDSIVNEYKGNITDQKIDKDQFIAQRRNSEEVRVLVYNGNTPVIGAKVKNLNSKKEYFTNFDGSLAIDISGENNVTLEITSLGYKSTDMKVSMGKDYFIELKLEPNELNEVVVMGYGVQKKMSMTASVTRIEAKDISNSLQGSVSGIAIRGTSSIHAKEKQFILVDGVPFDGDFSKLDPTTISSVNLVKDQSMSTLYGSRAANGVLMVQTKAGIKSNRVDQIPMPYLESGNTMRVNFYDDAFWQPILKTDAYGKASFEAIYPDDITNWRTFFIAKGMKDFTDIKELNIRSFKAVSAHLATPRFAIRGDRFTAMGRIVNYLQDSLQVSRTINNRIISQEANLKIGKSYRDPITVHTVEGDSVQLSYSIGLSNGYFDGEKRSVPIFEKGLEQSQGDFKVLNSPEEYQLKTSSDLREVTLHVEANSLEMVQREIEQIGAYKYLCNEQLASKLSALLSKKQLCKLMGKPFEEEKKILGILKELQKNKNANGGWGWWNKSETVLWISNHVVNIMLDAEDAGYSTSLDRKQYIEREELALKQSLASLDHILDKDKLTFAKEGLFSSLLFLNRLDSRTDYKSYFFEIDTKLESASTKDKLLKYLLISKLGLSNKNVADTILKYASKTILGGLYWTSGVISVKDERIFIRPTETNTENTLLAYNVLKAIGGQESHLENIRNYFFAQRQSGNWSNIYESSRIVRSILPDLLKEGENIQPPVAIVNGKRINTFPYKETLAPTEQIRVRKEGTGPLFVTAYQKFWNENPIIEKEKGLTVSTRFKDKEGMIAGLKEGTPVKLEVTLELAGEAEYIQIEVPIPAGCSYESKSIGYYRKEAHREHFKDRVVIFCNRLNKGAHTFEIELLPRYNGTYTLNPAKVELMYFPTFYGNEKIKEVVVD